MKITPVIEVGIQFKPFIELTFSGNYKTKTSKILSGKWKATMHNNAIRLQNEENVIDLPSGESLLPEDHESNKFTLHEVTIGINFHWERNEDQTFKGGLKLLIEDEKITAINILPIEDYLISVISSEMSATSSMELLKAHFALEQICQRQS